MRGTAAWTGSAGEGPAIRPAGCRLLIPPSIPPSLEVAVAQHPRRPAPSSTAPHQTARCTCSPGRRTPPSGPCGGCRGSGGARAHRHARRVSGIRRRDAPCWPTPTPSHPRARSPRRSARCLSTHQQSLLRLLELLPLRHPKGQGPEHSTATRPHQAPTGELERPVSPTPPPRCHRA